MTTRALGSAEETELSRAERDIRARLGDRRFDFRSMAAISNIYRAATTVRNHMEQQVLSRHKLSWSAFTVMWVLWIWGEQETGRVAAETGTTKGTLTGVLKTLESRRLVLRSSHPDDGRRVLVRLSPRGQALIEEVFPLFNAEETLVASALTDEEADQLAHLLRLVTARVDAARAEARPRVAEPEAPTLTSSRSGRTFGPQRPPERGPSRGS